MTFIILILIIVLVLLYAVSHVIPVGGIIVSVVGVGFFIALDVHLRRRKQKDNHPEE
jgi:hypothetical protein